MVNKINLWSGQPYTENLSSVLTFWKKNNLIGNNLQLLPKERENTNTLLMELHGNLYLPAGF